MKIYIVTDGHFESYPYTDLQEAKTALSKESRRFFLQIRDTDFICNKCGHSSADVCEGCRWNNYLKGGK